jgi:hypothetical protein
VEGGQYDAVLDYFPVSISRERRRGLYEWSVLTYSLSNKHIRSSSWRHWLLAAATYMTLRIDLIAKLPLAATISLPFSWINAYLSSAGWCYLLPASCFLRSSSYNIIFPGTDECAVAVQNPNIRYVVGKIPLHTLH